MYSVITDRNSKRQSRRVRPGAKHVCPPEKRKYLTHSSTSISSGGCGPIASDAPHLQLQELQQRLCPVTGILSDIWADYRILPTPLGRGHYGIVHECVHRLTRRTFAVKTVDKSQTLRLDRLRREVHLLRELNHRGIARMVDCYEDADHVHIVTEKCDGGELFDHIAERTRTDGCLSEERAAGIMRSLLETVAYLHANDIVHRDIKPENILLESNREEDSPVKLIDFGLSRRHKKGEELMTSQVGTSYYMAPELLGGRYDRACDVWSLGTVAYIMLCGYPPFNGETDADIYDAIENGEWHFQGLAWSDKSEEALDFVRSLMRREADRRPTAKEALEHPWIKKNTTVSQEDREVVQNLYSRIQALRTTINRFKRSQQQHQR